MTPSADTDEDGDFIAKARQAAAQEKLNANSAPTLIGKKRGAGTGSWQSKLLAVQKESIAKKISLMHSPCMLLRHELRLGMGVQASRGLAASH